jgi:hypothetical protein
MQACIILMPLAFLSSAIRETLIRPGSWIAVAVAAALFLRMVFDPKIQRDVQAINIGMRDQRRVHGRIGILDPRWGLFGSLTGDRALLITRAIATAEFVLALVLARRFEGHLLLFAFATFFATIELSILHGARMYADQDPE